MKNSFEELYSENNEWTKSKFATYGNAKNTWTGYKNQPQILDYIFYQNSDSANPPNHLLVEPWYYHGGGSKITLLPC